MRLFHRWGALLWHDERTCACMLPQFAEVWLSTHVLSSGKPNVKRVVETTLENISDKEARPLPWCLSRSEFNRSGSSGGNEGGSTCVAENVLFQDIPSPQNTPFCPFPSGPPPLGLASSTWPDLAHRPPDGVGLLSSSSSA